MKVIDLREQHWDLAAPAATCADPAAARAPTMLGLDRIIDGLASKTRKLTVRVTRAADVRASRRCDTIDAIMLQILPRCCRPDHRWSLSASITAELRCSFIELRADQFVH